MELITIIWVSGVFLIAVMWILTTYKITYKKKCILHDWEYKFGYGDYWAYTGTFLRSNERYVCKKCHKTVKK